MADIAFACSSCRQSLEAPEEMAGEDIACPSCQAVITIPGPSAPRKETAAAPGCPSCGAALVPGAVLCTACGYHLVLRKKLATDFK